MIRREESARAIEIVGGKARKGARERTVSPLHVPVNQQSQPVKVALIEATAKDLSPGHDLEQGKAHADTEALRLHVSFVFARSKQ